MARRRARIETGGGGFLDDLLVAALGGAVALEQMDGVAVRVGEDLHLDMAGRSQIALDQHAVVAEGGGGFLARRFQRGGEARRRSSPPACPRPPPPETALMSSGKADARGLRRRGNRGPGCRRDSRAGRARRLAFHQRLGGGFATPIARIAAGGGPTQISPASAQASAKAGFSDRNP